MKVATTLKRWLFAMLVGFVIVACDQAADNFVANHSSASQSSAADCRAVQHLMGETQCGQPQKIVVLGPNLLEILMSLEMQPAGVADYFEFRRACTTILLSKFLIWAVE